MMMDRHQIGGAIASLPLEGRDRGWGSVTGPLNYPLPGPPLKGEGAQEPMCEVPALAGGSH